MNILYLHQYFTFPWESGGTRSYDLAISFLSRGYSVEVVSATTDERHKDREGWFSIEEQGLKVHYIYIPYNNQMSYRKRIGAFIKFMVASSRKIMSLDKDIVLATSTPLTIGIPTMVNKWIKKTPYIFEVRDVWPEAVIAIGAINNRLLQKLLYFLEKTIYKNAAVIVPLSTDMKESIITRYPMYDNKIIHVIENISEINRFQQQINENAYLLENYGIPSGRFAVLYAGTFGKVNGLKYVVSLAEKTSLLNEDVIYILIGNGAEKDDVIEMLRSKQLLNRIVYVLPSVPKNQLPQLYSEVSMGSSFVIPVKELWANSANKFFDTLAAARPVLINHGGWQQEVITDKNLGYVLPPELTDEAVSDFVAYTKDKNLSQTQQLNAFETAKNSYSLEVATQKYISIFKQIESNV